jgi:hypothetical protein
VVELGWLRAKFPLDAKTTLAAISRFRGKPNLYQRPARTVEQAMIAASIRVTRCERGPRVRVMGWASGRVRSGRLGMGNCKWERAGI